jgi:Icc-related predicted phosphoesterase
LAFDGSRRANINGFGQSDLRKRAENEAQVMKLQIFSDLHTDVAKTKPIKIADDVDAVIVAGDVCEGIEKAFRTLRTIVPDCLPILFVAGNHEFYRRFVRDEIALARKLAPSFQIFFLERETVMLKRVLFVGCTLWTDYCIFGERNQAAVMTDCARGMNDHRLIGWQKQPWLRFRPQEAALLHHQSRNFLSEARVTSDTPTVVIVHHGVHEKSIHPRFRSDPLTGAFVSDCSQWIESAQPDLIVHGHVHHSLDYRIGRTRVICNPHGYGSENPDFDGTLVMEVGS